MKKVKYGASDPKIKGDFALSYTSESQFYNNDNILKDAPIDAPKNPIELYSVILDGTSNELISNQWGDGMVLGFWSEQVSNEDCSFSDSVVIELKSNKTVKTKGVTLEFDVSGGVFPTDVLISYYLGGKIVNSIRYYPDSTLYYFKNEEIEYDEVLLRFYSLNVPYNRLKIQSVEFGEMVVFLPSEILSTTISHESDISGLTLPISTTSVVLKTNRADKLNFKEQQKIVVENDGNIESTTYITAAKRISKNQFNIEAEDVISLLENTEYLGGAYNFSSNFQRISARDMMIDILNIANVAYEIEDGLGSGVYLQGCLPITNCRVALQQVAFGCNAVILTSYTSGVKIVSYDTIAQNQPQKTGLGKLKSQNINENKAITSVILAFKKYYWNNMINLDKKKVVFETDDETLIGTSMLIKTSSPCAYYEINGATSREEHPNYIKFIVNSVPCVINAVEYTFDNFETTVQIYDSAKPNPKKITGALLIDYNNIDKLLNKCYNYYSRNRNGKMNIIDIDKIKIGDVLDVKSTYDKDIQGIVVSQKYSLIGNTFVKETEIIGG